MLRVHKVLEVLLKHADMFKYCSVFKQLHRQKICIKLSHALDPA